MKIRRNPAKTLIQTVNSFMVLLDISRVATIIETIYSWVWSPALVGLCLLSALYFSLRTRFVQVRRFGEMFRLLFSTDKKQKTGITSFQAFAMALSGRVGTGNIVGVATAIGFGGPGAIVWMWVIAFFGAGSAFVEATLAQIFKERAAQHLLRLRVRRHHGHRVRHLLASCAM